MPKKKLKKIRKRVGKKAGGIRKTIGGIDNASMCILFLVITAFLLVGLDSLGFNIFDDTATTTTTTTTTVTRTTIPTTNTTTTTTTLPETTKFHMRIKLNWFEGDGDSVDFWAQQDGEERCAHLFWPHEDGVWIEFDSLFGEGQSVDCMTDFGDTLLTGTYNQVEYPYVVNVGYISYEMPISYTRTKDGRFWEVGASFNIVFVVV